MWLSRHIKKYVQYVCVSWPILLVVGFVVVVVFPQIRTVTMETALLARRRPFCGIQELLKHISAMNEPTKALLIT